MIKNIVALFEGKDRIIYRQYVFLSVISPIMDMFSFSMVLLIMNRVIQNGKTNEKLIWLTFAMALFCIVKSGFDLYKNIISNRMVWECSHSISLKIYDLIMNESLQYHNERTPMQALSAVKEDTAACVGILVKFIGVVVSGIMVIGYGVILVAYGKVVGICLLVPLLLFIWIVYYTNHKFFQNYGEKRRSLSIRNNAQVTTAFGAFKEMKIDNRSAYLLERYDETGAELYKVQEIFAFRSGLSSVVMQETVMIFLFLVMGVMMLYNANLLKVMSSMIIYVGLLIRMMPLLQGIVGNLIGIDYAKKSYEVVREGIERYEKIVCERNNNEIVRKKELTLKQGLRIEGLTFGYTPERKIFDNASIEIPAGKSVAIIGVSGSGKTTFLDLILGLHKAWDGKVYYDDYEMISQSDSEGKCMGELGQIVSYIPQIVYLNGETIRHNVAFFEEEEAIDEARIINCLKASQIWEDVSKMPKGIDTLIGENGTAISGGQRQRIALARALYKDFELLVMDEATAALDMETELAVIDSIRKIKRDKTLLMVTHHMSLANECDIIYKIENQKFIRVS